MCMRSKNHVRCVFLSRRRSHEKWINEIVCGVFWRLNRNVSQTGGRSMNVQSCVDRAVPQRYCLADFFSSFFLFAGSTQPATVSVDTSRGVQQFAHRKYHTNLLDSSHTTRSELKFMMKALSTRFFDAQYLSLFHYFSFSLPRLYHCQRIHFLLLKSKHLNDFTFIFEQIKLNDSNVHRFSIQNL